MNTLPWLADLPAALAALGRSHAVLLQGAAGDGLFQAAELCTRSWLCESDAAGTPRPCGTCPACSRVASATHPDLRRLLPEALARQLGDDGTAGDAAADEGEAKARRKPSRQIRIDEVRAAIDWVATSSSRGRGKVILIHPADALNPQAANALLKTLEEPPPGARLLLSTAQPDRLLPTVRSRCQTLRLVPPSREQAQQWLRQQGIGDADVLLAAAAGRPLDAVEWSAAGVDAARWRALPAAVLRQQAAVFEGWPLARVLEVLRKLCHDAMAVAVGARPRFFDSGPWPDAAALPSLAAWSRDLAVTARRIDHPWNERLMLEDQLLRASQAWSGRWPGVAASASAGAGSDTLLR